MADIGKIQKREITEEMRESYIDYAMSVIVARALPDARDGLKPVHRRILYTAHELGLRHSAKFVKSARIVGEVLGKYHPHGDIAVYDALVRMAQGFSLRYPLIDGQGNFGCFTKGTKVKLADGRDLSFEELIKECEQKKRNYTYTINSLGLISIAEIKNPRLTKKEAEIMRVVLDNEEEIKCTLNHPFMLRDGTYKEARDLKTGDSLMPLYQKLSTKTDRLNREGYVLVYQNKTGEWIPAHHLADNYNLTIGKYTRSAGRVRHHLDFNKLNNNPDNIKRVRWGEHWRIHSEQAAEQHKNNEEHRKKIAEGRKKFWLNPANRARYAERLSRRNLKNWQDTRYREKMRRFLSDVNKEYIKNHPEKKLELSQRATRTLKRLWRDPAYRQLFHKKIIAANKNRLTNNTGAVKFLKVCREVFQEFKKIDGQLYEQKRTKVYSYGRATSWETGIKKYFKNNERTLLETLNKNHQVKKIEFLDCREDVYDLTIDKTHNFSLAAGVFVHNSIDGDSAAAMRYTEARLSSIADGILADIDKDTVDFVDTYDATRTEPTVLPSAVPNLLLNGSLGIAVGMATNIPPHNLGELSDALIHLTSHPDASVDELMTFVKGPDFPTGGFIFNEKEISQAYATGRGAILTRGKAEIAEKTHSAGSGGEGRGTKQIIITEIPYQVNKAELITKIAELAKDKKIEGIKDIRDESDKEGLRIAIDLKAEAFPQKVLNGLYKFTDLEKNFNMNMLALVDGIQPQTLSLKVALEEYLKHRQVIVRRRSQFDLARAKERAHILEGLSGALDKIDAVIQVIKKSRDREDAHKNLIARFKFTALQAAAILEMKLQALAALEKQKIEDELKEKLSIIRELEVLLKDNRKILGVVKKEIAEVKAKYGDERRTKVVKSAAKEIAEEDIIPEEETIVVLTRGGYVKRVKPEAYRVQKRGGKGVVGMETKEEDVVEHFLTANTHSDLLFFTDLGKVYQIKAYEIPEASRTSRGKAVHNFISIGGKETVQSILGAPKTAKGEKHEGYLVMATKNGIIKKVAGSAFEHVRRSGLVAIKLKKGDTLSWVKITKGKDDIVTVTKLAQSIRFSEKDVRAMGRGAAGVKAIRLRKNDEVIGLDVIPEGETGKEIQLLVVTEQGYGKRTPIKEYKRQRRGGGGVKTAKLTAKNGTIVSMRALAGETDLIAISRKGQVIRTQIQQIAVLSRATQGVRVMKLSPGDAVASVTVL